MPFGRQNDAPFKNALLRIENFIETEVNLGGLSTVFPIDVNAEEDLFEFAEAVDEGCRDGGGSDEDGYIFY